jgi:hypothetical protein
MLERYKNLIFVVVILAIVSGVVALLTYHPAPVVIKILPPPATATPQPIRVYVVGAVALRLHLRIATGQPNRGCDQGGGRRSIKCGHEDD